MGQTKQTYAERAREVQDTFGGDKEVIHIKLDEILCEALREYGEDELVDIFEEQRKWYA